MLVTFTLVKCIICFSVNLYNVDICKTISQTSSLFLHYKRCLRNKIWVIGLLKTVWSSDAEELTVVLSG